MKEVAKIDFFDTSENDNGFAIVSAEQNRIRLVLSLEHNGDIDVFFEVRDCRKLVEALQQAIAVANAHNS